MQTISNSFRLVIFLFAIVGPASSAWGQLIGEIREGQFVIVANEPTHVAGINLRSASSLLTPIPKWNTPGRIRATT